MQRTCVLLAAAGVACAPLGCQTVSDVFNEPPADTQRTEREEEAREAERRAEREREDEEAREARRERVERRDEALREEEREEARREARRRADERVDDRGERERRGARRQAREYIASSSCPVAVDGARVSMSDINDGIALEFRAEDDADREAVRERARRLMNTQREVRSARDVDDQELEALPPARVEYDIQPDGARIEFKVDRESDLRELRTQLRERIAILRDEGECPRDFMTMRTRRSGRAG